MAYRSELAGADVDWDSRYIAHDTPWDKGTAHPALVDWLKKNPMIGHVLVPGCGKGHDVRAISDQSTAAVVGIDISPTALQLASAFGKKSNESYILGDFLSGTAVKNQTFDWVFEHTCFCAIPPTRRSDYVSAAASALRPGGHLLAVFFKNPENPDYQSPPFPCEVEELNQLFSPHFEMIESIENIPTYSGREGREILRLLRKF